MRKVSWLKHGCLFIAIFVVVWSNLNFTAIQIQNLPLMPPPESINYFTFGFDETIGDFFWLSAIQNFSTCEQNRGSTPMSPHGTRMGLDRNPTCQRSWLYHVLNLVLELLPRFHYAARVGPVTLSVVVDDIEGATLIFEKAMRNFPKDWVIMTRAAYHYVFELEDYQRGAQLYYEAAKLGAPSWMALYASKLTDEQGRKEMAIRMIKNFMQSQDLKPGDKIHFINKLKELESE